MSIDFVFVQMRRMKIHIRDLSSLPQSLVRRFYYYILLCTSNTRPRTKPFCIFKMKIYPEYILFGWNSLRVNFAIWPYWLCDPIDFTVFNLFFCFNLCFYKPYTFFAIDIDFEWCFISIPYEAYKYWIWNIHRFLLFLLLNFFLCAMDIFDCIYNYFCLNFRGAENNWKKKHYMKLHIMNAEILFEKLIRISNREPKKQSRE